MATKTTPIFKLNNGNSDYYPLTVANAVALSKPITVKSNIGGFKAGEIITIATTVYEILAKLFNYPTKEFKYDKITIKTNKVGEICVDRNSLFTLDNLTLKEDNNHKISVDIDQLIDHSILMIRNGRITIDLSRVIGGDQVLNGHKTFSDISTNTLQIGTGKLYKNGDGLSITGVIDSEDETSVVTKKYVSSLLDTKDTYLSESILDTLGMKTCYQVRCNKENIKAFTISNINGIRYECEVPAGHIEVLKLRSSQKRDNMNVIVSWGDGTSTTIKNTIPKDKKSVGKEESLYIEECDNDNEISYYLTHIYPNDTSIYKVSIYGNSYWGVHHDSNYPNLLCKVFDSNLPICNCVRSVCDIAINALSLQEINLPAYYDFANVENFSGAFKNCLNLKRVSGFKKYIFLNTIRNAASVFENCKNLIYCDMHLPSSSDDWQVSNSNFYDGCCSLNMDLVELLPPGGFTKKVLSMNNVFRNCKKITCSDWDYVNSILWNDNIIWKNISECFSGCSDDILSHIPESWGGTRKIIFNGIIIVRNIDEVYNLVQNIMNHLDINVSITNEFQLYETIKLIANKNKISIKLTNNSDLGKALETLVVSFGAKQLITLF